VAAAGEGEEAGGSELEGFAGGVVAEFGGMESCGVEEIVPRA
jgi:hypothetical protein